MDDSRMPDLAVPTKDANGVGMKIIQVETVGGNSVAPPDPDRLEPGTASQSMASPAPNTSYSYRRLDFVDNFEIRVLKMNACWNDSDPITCSLEHVQLFDPGQYSALSYCWGDPKNKARIHLEDSMIDITPNLHDALKAVRRLRSSQSQKAIRIWVDSLCIDQQNNEERSHQVRHMREIYSRTEEVLCWVADSRMPAISPETNQILTADQLSVSKKGFLSGGTKMLDILEDLFSTDYWRRVWVIQEITVAPKATILYGDAVIPWTTVQKLLAGLDQSTIVLKNQHIRENVLHLLKFSERVTINSSISLLEAMIWSCHTLATQPRDKIFALLGLCHDSSTLVPLPNYKQSLEMITADMVWNIMTTDRSLDLIWLRGTECFRGLKLPSWIPDIMNAWNRPGTIQELEFHKIRRKYDKNPMVQESTSQVLKVLVKIMGSIEHIGPGMTTDGTLHLPVISRNQWTVLTSKLAKMNSRDWEPPKEDMVTRDQIWDTLLMGRLRETATSEQLRMYLSMLWTPMGRGSVKNISLIVWIDQNASFKVRHLSLKEWSQVMSGNEKISQYASPNCLLSHYNLMQVKALGSNISEADFEASEASFDAFLTTLGRILKSGMRLAALKEEKRCASVAMVHPEAQEGDIICSIRGCSIPVVLRRDPNGNNRASVVGGAYISEADQGSLNYKPKWANFGKDQKVETFDLY